jgi:hypothetical protein
LATGVVSHHEVLIKILAKFLENFRAAQQRLFSGTILRGLSF